MARKSPLEGTALAALWDVDPRTLPWWRAWPITVLRVLFAVARDVTTGNLTLHATSLVYTTLLSFVPLLALSFSVLKGFGVHNQVEPMLQQMLEPLGAKGEEITEQVIGFVDNINVGILGALGLGLLLFTVVSLMQKVEAAFNETWRVGEIRSFARRFSDYLSVLMVGPVLIFAGVGVITTLMASDVVVRLTAIEPFGSLVATASRLAPAVLVGGGFAFVYAFMPNTRVRLASALVGGAVAGALWVTAGWGFASFIATSTRYTAIYSAFATLILFLIWLYFNWLIVLIGGNIAFYHQHPEHLRPTRGPLAPGGRTTERLALLAVVTIAASHYRQEAPWTLERLTQRLNTPGEVLGRVVQALEAGGLLARTADEPPVYLPARPFDAASVKDVLDAVRRGGEPPPPGIDLLPPQAAVDAVLDEVDRTVAEALRGRTIKDLALTAGPAGEARD
ncbi:MAG: YhjD/YihY/BrkB family envelope integrity protein [Rhodospirillales bacterium]